MLANKVAAAAVSTVMVSEGDERLTIRS